jgi:RimJ/RimL family protein N-acetyltransferase
VPALAVPDPPLSDGVVTLRPWTAADVAALVEACQDPEIARRTLVPSPYTEDDARSYLQRVTAGWQDGGRASFAVVEATGHDVPLGAAGLPVIDWHQLAADVGYWLAAPARGRGFATRAVELLAGWAFGPLGLERLELRTNEDNAASHAVARRAGFAPSDRPLVHRPECDHMPDVFFMRLRA